MKERGTAFLVVVVLLFLFVNYNYSSVGGYVATAYVNSSTLNDSYATGVVV